MESSQSIIVVFGIMIGSLDDVVVFVAVVEAGSFTAAGRRLGMPTSTVSRRVTRLEERLGVRLMQRSTRRSSLTDAGRRYFEQGAQALAELESVEAQIADAQTTPRGRVRVAAPLAHAWTMRIVDGFLTEHAQVRVEVDFTSRAVNLVEEGYDVAITPGPLVHTSVVARKLMDSPFVLVASPAYLEERGRPRRVGDLSRHECILFGSRSDRAEWVLGPEGRSTKVTVSGRVAVNSMAAVLDAALAGRGVALVPKLSCRDALVTARLVSVLPRACPPPVALFVTYPVDRHLPAAVRAFVAYTIEAFADVAAAVK